MVVFIWICVCDNTDNIDPAAKRKQNWWPMDWKIERRDFDLSTGD